MRGRENDLDIPERIHPYQMMELQREINRTTNPKVRSILEQEMQRLRDIVSFEVSKGRQWTSPQTPPAMWRLLYEPGNWEDPRREIIDRRPSGYNTY